MKKILSFFLSLACGLTSVHAQDVYGMVTGSSNSSFSKYSYHSDIYLSLMGPWAAVSATTDLAENYYYFVDYVDPSTPKLLVTHNVVTHTEVPITIDNVLRHPEYDDKTIWSIDGFCMYSCDPLTGSITNYDSVFRQHGEASVPPFIYHTAFNHATKTYYFNMCEIGNCNTYSFCQYNVATKTLTVKQLPPLFSSFDYSPTNDRCYFLKNGDPINGSDTTAGIYAYDIAANTMTQVYTGWVSAASYMTMDPVKNRIFFQYDHDLTMACRFQHMGCYRINSHQLDTHDLTNRVCYYDLFEFLPTYSDTTTDAFPEAVATVKKAQAIQVYPNPAADELNISCKGMGDAPLLLSDMTGRVVLRDVLKGNKAQVNVSTLATGQYILRIGNSSSMVSIVH